MSRAGGHGARLTLRRDLPTAARGWRWTRRPLAPASAQEHTPVGAGGEFPTGWARHPAIGALRSAVHRGALAPLVHSQVRARVDGRDHLTALVPPVIFAANHTSHLDTPLLLDALPPAWRRRTAVAAAADYFFDTAWRAVGSALVFNTFPIERRGPAGGGRRGGPEARPTTPTAQRLLGEGWNLVVFPEGSRSEDGWATPLRSGVAHLASATGAPVVPVALRGTYAAMPRGRAWPVPGRRQVAVRFGAPLRPAPGEAPRAFLDRVAAALATLMDEDATTWWQAARRAADGSTPPLAGPPGARWRRVWAATAAVPGRRDGQPGNPWGPAG